MNASIEQGSKWDELLQKVMLQQKVPTFFTDTIHAAFTWVEQRINLRCGDGACVVEINPFRSPVRGVSAESNMPKYSNGFVFIIKA